MLQCLISTQTDETTARVLMALLEDLLESESLPVSAFENPEDHRIWSLAIYVPSNIAGDLFERITAYVKQAGYDQQFICEEIPETNWVAASLRDLASVRAGRFVVHGSHETETPKSHEIAVQIDAGLAFGTGHHGTTAGCLDMFSRVSKRQQFRNILDLGAGSGVLAIAVAKLMPTKVLASDIDPVATETATSNCHLNGVHSQVKCITANGFTHPEISQRAPFDLIIANILAKPLQMMAPDIARHMSPGGTVILSGLLPHQRSPLVSAFRLQGFHLQHYHLREGWLVLVMNKPA